MKSALVVATYNRGYLLKNRLQRLTNLTTTDEILVVDDGGTDNTESIVNSFKDSLPIRYIYNHSPQWTICSLAKNIGVKNTDADIIITIDPETLFITDVVKQLLTSHEIEPDTTIAAGTIYFQQQQCSLHPDILTNSSERLNWELVEEYTSTGIKHYNPKGYVKTKGWMATYAVLYKRDWLMNIGGWDEEFPANWGWDDTDLHTRLMVFGHGQKAIPEIEAIHQYHPTVACPDPNAQPGIVNSKYFFAKNFGGDGMNLNNPNIIANKNHEWGKIKTR